MKRNKINVKKFETFTVENTSIKDKEEIQQYIDVIDLDPDNSKYKKYIDILKKKFNIIYEPPTVRFEKEIALVDKLSNINSTVETNKGLTVNILSKKTPNLLSSITLEAIYENKTIGKVGFNINMEDNTLRIGGAEIDKEYRRKGIYTEMVNIILEICEIYNLELIETGRSEDAAMFWKNK